MAARRRWWGAAWSGATIGAIGVVLATGAHPARAADPAAYVTTSAAAIDLPPVLDAVARLVRRAATPGAPVHASVEGRHHVRLVWDSPVQGLSVASGVYDLLEPSTADVSDAEIRQDGLRQTEMSVRLQLRFAF